MTQENNPNSHIEAYLDYYCSLSHAPGFAVLLKGQWGSGKTWFIKKYYDKLKADKQKCLYVSLYGMTTFSEIEDAFFQQLHPVLSSKGMAITGKIVKGLIKGTIKIDLDSDGKDEGTLNPQVPEINLPDYLKDTDKSILIFDDLERCQIELGSILGYINYFVEHQDLKIVIIANEDELVKESSYKNIKEKLIGKTFGVSLDFEGALENFITVANNSDVRQFLSDNTQLLQKLYEEAESENLRILKQVFLDFDRIFAELPDKAKNKPEILQDILTILSVFSIEIKSGRMEPKEINKLEKEYGSVLRNQGMDRMRRQDTNSVPEENIEPQTSLQKMLGRYPNLNLHEPFPSKTWWQTFFDKGIIDAEELKQSLPSSKYFQDENTPNWIRLWHFHYLTDDDFSYLLKKVKSEYCDRQFSDIGEIKHITGILLNLSDIGLYSRTKAKILENSKRYIDQFVQEAQPEKLRQDIAWALDDPFSGYLGLAFSGRELPEFQEFVSYIKEAYDLKMLKSLPNDAQDLLDTMQSDIWKFYEMICPRSLKNQYVSGIYCEIPILKYIEPAVFVKKIVSMNFEHQRIIYSALTGRYKFDGTNEELIEELDWLKSVRDLLLKEADNRKGKLSGYRLNLLVKKCFNPAIETLDAKHSPA
ncbi:MAG: P-loop NTPase fold protein [Coleofasciculus sp. A1-SPW-01]|uniref:P-loop NTPase fold protein n=1 Tax=Coleofasciculus sp. A1-SPW-01 TaxID=3070819 RepID=UPI003303864B